MRDVLISVFKVAGAILTTILLWYFIIGTPTKVGVVRKSAWDVGNAVCQDLWAFKTGNDGCKTRTDTEGLWNGAEHITK